MNAKRYTHLYNKLAKIIRISTKYGLLKVGEKYEEELVDSVTIPQLPFTCWNSIIETLEKGVKYVQSSQ